MRGSGGQRPTFASSAHTKLFMLKDPLVHELIQGIECYVQVVESA